MATTLDPKLTSASECHHTLQDVAHTAERRLPEFTTATQAEKFKEQEKSVAAAEEASGHHESGLRGNKLKKNS